MSYLEGKSYQEIACDLDRRAKSIDNALAEGKKKTGKMSRVKDNFILTKKKFDSKI